MARLFPGVDPEQESRTGTRGRPDLLRQSQIRRLFWGMANELSEKGFGDASIASICERSHVSIRTLYEHFESKESLFVALHQAASSFVRDVVEETVATAGSWPDRLIALARAPIQTVATHPLYFQGIIMGAMTSGHDILALRQGHLRQLSGMVVRETERARRRDHELGRLTAPLSLPLARAIIEGGESRLHTGLRGWSARDVEAQAAQQLLLLARVAFPRVPFEELAADPERAGLDEFLALTDG